MSIEFNIYSRYRKRLKAVLLSVLLLTAGLAQAQVLIKGNVHGGGLEGQVKNPKYDPATPTLNIFGNTTVTINDGTIEGSVFGGGKGVENNETSGLVEGNTTVTMKGGVVERSIYGGGYLGSVGKFTYDSTVIYTDEQNYGIRVPFPTACATGTGRATVTLTGGSVGLEGSLMPWNSTNPDDDDRGWIFAGSAGLVDSINYPKAIGMAVVNTTHLEISGSNTLVTASVYGGCENGLVLDSTFVEIKGGQIGTGFKGKHMSNDLWVGDFEGPYSEELWTAAINAVKADTIGTALEEGHSLYNKFYACDSWIFGYDDDNNPNTPQKYNVYDIFYGEPIDPNDPESPIYAPEHTGLEGTNGQTFFGNVFGGGSGFYPFAPGIWRRSAGRVNKNTRIEISGGHILTSVYGGNETTDVMGKATVIMTGGTIGIPRAVDSINKHPVLCNLFGAGKGDQRVWANKWTNVEETDVKFTGGVIFGSIFGGGEDGHVMGDTKLIVKEDENEILIGTFGYTGFEGHVYGSGRGFSGDALTAGGVCGNTNVTIKNGTILGSVYGGGRNGSVGPKLFNADEIGYGLIQLGDYGKTKVIIEGGTIGNDYEVANNPGGNVFGGSMGSLTILDGSPNPMWPRMSRVGSTEIQISQAADADTTLIKGSVYGGCGLGTVKDNAKVTIASGTIRGDVYGSGFGSDNTTMINNNVVGIYENGQLVSADTIPAIPLQRAGLVEGNTEIIMQGGRVLGNVYGGGMLASVGQIEAVHETPTDPNSTIVDYTPVANTGLAKITISGGQVGIPIPNPLPSSDYKPSVGYVYGGGKGIGDDVSNTYKAGVNVNSTFVTIDLPDANTADTTNNRIWCCVFGGGADGHVLDTTGVLIKSGVIGTYGKYRFEGNVFGGGRNDHGINYTAGRVGGNTHVTVEDGRVKSNVYGGGNSGSTGADLNGIAYATNLGEHGNTFVDIKGGKVGVIKYDYKNGHTSGALDTIINLGDGGNVYGGGRGKKENADLARVMRNTYVNISGGHVMNNVYGGGENGSVGLRNPITDDNDVITDYEPVENTGLATVNVTGGQVGPAPRVESGSYYIPCGLSGENGYVFGGGMGVSEDFITDPEHHPYSGSYYGVADVNYTKVTIDMPMPTSGDNNANRIWGSIFGGAEDGHVLGSDTVHFVNGLLGTHGTSSYDGNIFGGGRNYSKANYNAGRVRSNITVEMTGGQILGSIFGGGRLALTGVGLFGDVMVDANGKKYGSTHVMVKGGTIGNDAEEDPTESGKTYMETFTKYAMGDVYGGGKGSMEGIVGHPKASALLVALVKNTKVEISETDATNHPTRILGSVFGGGEVGNVGQFTWNLGVTDPLYDPDHPDPNHPTSTTIGNIALVDGTGKTEVTVSGGRIGLDKMKMDVTLVGGSDEDRYDLKYHYDVGHVFGGGEGLSGRNPNSYPTINPSSTTAGIYNNKSLLDLMAVVGETQVTIEGTAFVKGSVYGGSMSGRVLGDAKVKIDGGQIGAGYYVIDGNQRDSLYDPGKFFNPVTYFVTDHPTYADVLADDVLHGCVSWPYQADNQRPFDPIEILAGQTPTNGETWFGHVFGGGSGYYPYIVEDSHGNDSCVWDPDAGKVFGHTEVEITGGHILSNVYGGCQTTDVGNYVKDNSTHQLSCNSGGKAIVEMSGGSVGVPATISSIQAFPYTSSVFGGGQGNFRDRHKELNNVDSTRVVISGDAVVYGMVFGGSQNGHVVDSTKVIVSGGVIGITGLTGYDGCVFGGGQGALRPNPGQPDTLYAHAGRVGGNTRLIMTSGKALGNLYGGGLVALTGVGVDGWFDEFTNTSVVSVVYDSTNHGMAKVELSGGCVGNDFKNGLNLLKNSYAVGNVYGGGRGKLNEYRQDDLARLANSAVIISGSPTICGSVYGGGEMANVGYWRGYDLGWYATKTAATRVTITGSPTIGTELEFKDKTDIAYSHDPGDWTYYDTIRFVKYGETTNDTTYLKMLTHTRTGNVYGGGQGEAIITTDASHSVYGLEQGHCATTNVSINMNNPTNGVGGGNIMGSVFGGSEEGVIWGDTKVHIEGGGTIGTPYIKPSRWTGQWTTVSDTTYSYGSVFGGSYGKDYYSFFSSMNIDDPRPQMIDSVNALVGRVYGNTRVDIAGGYIRGNVYGGGDMAIVGDNMANTTTKNGVCTVNVSGGTIGPLDGTGLNAYVFGGGNGFANDPHQLRKAYANVDSTFVTVSGGKIWGSVFGGGNDAHTLGSTKVEVHAGANIGTDGLSSWDGNIFGGGRNFLNTNHSNGRVEGNIDITMDGGTLQGSIFGGGRLALSGVNVDGEFPNDNNSWPVAKHGNVTITVSGGEIGNGTDQGIHLLTGSDESVGDIFGSGKGDTKAYLDTLAGRVTNATINIYGENTLINGSVFGGGEMASLGWWSPTSPHAFYDNTGRAVITIGRTGTSDNPTIGTYLELDPDYIDSTLQINNQHYDPCEWTMIETVNGGKRVYHTCTGNVFGGCQGDVDFKGWDNNDPDTWNNWPYMGRSRTSTITINKGTIMGEVYGGAEQGVMDDTTHVTINGGTIGTPATASNDDQYYYGGVYGAGYGSDDPDESDRQVSVYGNETSAKMVAGRVYGNTLVDVLGGTIQGDVYGGASFAYVGGDTDDGRGNVLVNIGNPSQQNDPNKGVTFRSVQAGDSRTGGSVYGANNRSGSPLGNVKVNVYSTAHNGQPTINPANNEFGGDTYPNLPQSPNEPTPEWLATVSNDTTNFAIYQVFGGSNKTAYIPHAGKRDTVYVYECYENTIFDIYGGCNAASMGSQSNPSRTVDANLIIKGGRFHRVFGGGNGSLLNPANIYGAANTTIDGGLIDELYGGSNGYGNVNQINLAVSENSDCEIVIGDGYGGGNESPQIGDIVVTLDCNPNQVPYENFYAGSHEAVFYGNLTLNVFGGIIENLFGGSKGTTQTAADIKKYPSDWNSNPGGYSQEVLDYMQAHSGQGIEGTGGNVTVNIFGGNIKNAFGGCDINGNIEGQIQVNVFNVGGACDLDLVNVYGASRNTAYTPIFAPELGTERLSPEVNVIHGTVKGQVHGGGEGVLATVTATPVVNIGFDTIVMGVTSTQLIKRLNDTVAHHSASAPLKFNAQVKGNVYGGGAFAQVIGNTQVHVRQGEVGDMSVYQIQDEGGVMVDSIIPGLNIPYYRLSGGYVYGGGQGNDTLPNGSSGEALGFVSGNTYVGVSGDAKIHHSVYGGGMLGSVGHGDFEDKTSGVATVVISGGEIGPLDGTGLNAYVYGGGRGKDVDFTNHYKSFANVDSTSVIVCDSARIYGSIFGGGSDGHVLGDARVQLLGKTGTRDTIPVIGTNGMTSWDGNIFGGGRNYWHTNFAAGRVGGNIEVEMRDGLLLGNIYGGGRLALTGVDKDGAMQDGAAHGNTKIMVKGGTVGNNTSTNNLADPAEIVIETFSGSSMGNIYGGGKGMLMAQAADTTLLLGLTKNTTIEISDTLGNNTHVYGIVLGGGEIANVGQYTLTQDPTTHAVTNIAVANNTGKTKVKISGGIIGGDRTQMRPDTYEPGSPWLLYNDDLGYVYGGGEGWSDDPSAYATVQESATSSMSLLDLIATVQNTEVTITSDTVGENTEQTIHKPWVKASVFGGSESGHVRGNTKVTIAGGQIGAGYSYDQVNNKVVDLRYENDDLFVNPLTHPITNADTLAGTAHWDYSIPYYPFDPALLSQGTEPTDGKSWFGNVFGGGSGWFPYVVDINTDPEADPVYESHWNSLSGKVWGNTEVNITGGHILNNVYGANESTDVDGKSTIKMSGGTVGVPRTAAQIAARPISGYVFGGGCGDPRDIFDDETNVASTDVQITGGIVYGSVYGGAEDGHVLGDAEVTISEIDANNKPTIIGSTGRSDYDGHVFGGGRNLNYWLGTTAGGRVLGNVNINMTGGRLMGNMYGGGRMGSTGMDEYGDPIEDGTDRGYVTIKISGGTIGSAVDTVTIGNVFGGGKGKVDTEEGEWIGGVFVPEDQLYFFDVYGKVKETDITISDDARVHGNVFGGGEIAVVAENTNVTVEGGLIGSALTEGNPAKTRYNGSVFGGSKGYVGYWVLDLHVAGQVGGDATVNIKDGQVLENVYGGGEIASVNGNAHVNISGGQVGVEQIGLENPFGGNVFGGGLGRAGDDYRDHANVDSTKVSIDGGYIIGSVFGGGDNGHVLKSTVVNMTDGTVGQRNTLAQFITDSLEHVSNHIYTGSVLAGGRGIETAEDGNYSDITGIVYGNTNLTISGGTVRHAVYGGGGLSHVGTIDSIHDDLPCFKPGTGITKVTVSGGLVGPKCDDLIRPYDPSMSVADSTKYVDSTFMYLGGNAGWVFGAGCGLAGDTYKGLTFIDSTFVTISGSAQVVGAVYGGGENGHVARNTRVDVNGGTIGAVPLHGDSTGVANGASLEYRIDGGPYDGVTVHLAKKDGELNENEYGIGKHVFRGSVFGGGKGTDYTNTPGVYSMYAGRVYGDTWVNVSGNDTKIYNRVYGGGAMASVGKFTYYKKLSNIPAAGVPLTDSLQRITYLDGGVTHVTISGGTIGVGSTETDGNNQGFVIGGGRGLAGDPGDLTAEFTDEDPADQVVRMAYVESTNVTIKGNAKVKGNVFGGSVSGHVHGDAYVKVEGDAEIGYTYDNNTKVHGGWYSNVFGGGGGQKPYKKPGKTPHLSITAGRVYGNTKIEIKDGTVYNNVYGGGPIASVGSYDLRENRPAVAPNTGKTEVIITGGTVGLDGEDNGHVFGSGRGYPAPALAYLDSLSYAVETHVTIGTESTPNVTTTPTVKGSVYGSGENGHTYLKSNVNIHSGTVNHSVYGAGEGDDAYTGDDNKDHYNPIAGCVQGNTHVKMTGGLVKGNVYGGGRLASVGILLQETQHPNAQYNHADTVVWIAQMSGVDPRDYGNTKVEITGGTIGGDNVNTLSSGRSGFVFGGGKGTLLDPTVYPRWTELANVSTTQVTVGGNAVVKSSVYGGSEVGRVLDSTWVKIQGGEIGETDKTKRENMAFHRGNVFGGGSGNDSINYSGAGTGVGAGYVFMREAGRVNGNARVEMTGGQVYNSVYGGCEVTSVGIYGIADDAYHTAHPEVPVDALYWKSGGKATVTISGGNVGWKRTATQISGKPRYGFVYGAGKGDPRTYFNTWTNVKESHVTITTPTVAPITKDTIFGCVFGGGEEGHVLGDTYVKIEGDTTTTWIGTCGTTGADGNVFGSGRGKNPVALTAGGVGGNTRIDIEGGRMLGSIFGGGANASVGIWFTPDSITDPSNSGHNIEHPYYGKMIDGLDHGYTTVNINAGTIGHDDTDSRIGGNVYGGSRGTACAPDATPNPQRMAKVKETHVNISQALDVTSAMPGKQTFIMGSVFGSGEDGHVLNDTYVTVTNGQIGGKKWVQVDNYHEPEVCNDIYHGNVYGGGRGVDQYEDEQGNIHYSITAGKVSGNTNIEITGGRIVRSVYGGGNLSSVGDADNASTGLTSVNILGGYIGTSSNMDDYHGNVFGGGHGGIGGEYINLAYVKNTQVTIDSVARVFGSVFGGGEDGHVRKNTLVDVKGGAIGKNADTDVLHGNVYGGGRGIIISSNNVTNTAGEVFGHSTVNIEKSGRKDVNGNFYTPTVYHNVYGGGSRSVVGEYKVLNISDGTIKGNAFGGSRDIPKERTNTSPRWVNMWGGTIEGNLYGCSHNSIDNNPTNPHSDNGWASFINLSGGTINGNVFGGGFGGQIEGIAHDTVYGGVVKGSVGILIGKNAIESRALTEIGSADSLVHLENSIIPQGKLDIKGSVYAGSNQVLDSTWGKHAITGYSNIYIDGYGYNTTDGSTADKYMNISGGLFGSGSNCEAGKEGHNILVREFGTRINTTKNGEMERASRSLTTIQRAGIVMLDNVNVKLSGVKDISHTNNDTLYGVMKVDNGLYVTNASGIVLGSAPSGGNPGVAAFMDSIKEVKSLHFRSTTASVYQNMTVNDNNNWDWIGIQGNTPETAKLYYVASPGTPLTFAQENVILFNDTSKMVVRYNNRGTMTYGELKGFFRMKSPLSPYGTRTFAEARPKLTPENASVTESVNKADGGFLSYQTDYNFFNDAGDDGGDLYTNTKQYPYTNIVESKRDVVYEFREWLIRRELGNKWYVDGRTTGTFNVDYYGKDSKDNGRGLYPDLPKQTITKNDDTNHLYGIYAGTNALGGGAVSFDQSKDAIYVVGPVNALLEAESLNSNSSKPLKLYRYPGAVKGSDVNKHCLSGTTELNPAPNYGALIDVPANQSLTLNNVSVDGLYGVVDTDGHGIAIPTGFSTVNDTMPMVVTHKGATLALNTGTVLKNGYIGNKVNADVWYTNSDYTPYDGSGDVTKYHGAALFVDKDAIVNVSDSVYIMGNKQYLKIGTADAVDIESNVYLPTFSKSLTITDELRRGTRIGITSPMRNKAASYVNNTFSPVAVASSSAIALSAWQNCNFLDDQGWFFVNGHSASTPRTAYYKPSTSGKPDDNTNGNTVYFGWTWANVVRQQPPTTGYEVSDDNIDVKTKEGMAWLISQSAGMNGQTATNFSGKTIRQTADFSMGQYVWVPIGDETASFAGTYDGQGHLIDSVYIEYIGIGDKIYERNDYGLFGRVNKGTVKRTFVVDGKIRPAAKPQSSSKAGLDESYLPDAPEGDTLIDNVADMEGRGITDATAPYNIGGLVGYLEGNALVSNSEAAITVPFFSNDSLVVGGLVGLMANGTVHSSMAMPFVNEIHGDSDGKYWKGMVGGLVGSSTGGKILNSFASSRFGVLGKPTRMKIGGLLGKNTEAEMTNCYTALRSVSGDNLTKAIFGGIAAINTDAAKIDSCYVMQDTTYYVIDGNNYCSSTCHSYTPVISSNNLGYMCADNKVIDAPRTDTTLFQLLNNWVDKHSGHTYSRWARPGLSEVNGDLPVLLLDEFGTEANSHLGDFRSVATYKHSHVLQYGGPVRDGYGSSSKTSTPDNELDGAIGRLAAGDALFVYGDIVDTVKANPASKTKISVFEDAAIIHAGTLGSYDSTYVGITFDNSSSKAYSTPGINNNLAITNGVTLGGSYLLPRDWHMLSTPLKDAPLGFNYREQNAPVSGHDNFDVTHYDAAGYYNNPWQNNATEFGWLSSVGSSECSSGSGNYRYWMKSDVDGYFPYNRGALFSESGSNSNKPLASMINDIFIVNDPEHNVPSDECYISNNVTINRYPYGMDFYSWTEPHYHWINFKRNGPNHWHSDDPHVHLPYTTEVATNHTTSTTNRNEDNLITAKGYMAAIAIPTMLQAHGTLNSGAQSINITKTPNVPLSGWNLVGNPFHAYLDFEKVVALTSNQTVLDSIEGPNLGKKPFYVIYNADSCKNNVAYTAFLYYPSGGSVNGEYADRFIHPHQGFYVSAREGGALTFTEGMLYTRKDAGDSHFRDERPSYPLINLYLSSDKGCTDVTVVELERPEWGGATKLKELRVGNGLFYGHYDGESYAAIFAQKGAERVPIRFEAKEDDIFTIKWNTANADFHSLYLIDNITGVQYDMLRNDTYVFEGHKSDYKSRFYITFDVTGVDEYEHTSFVFFDGSQLVVTGEGDFEMVDVLGRVLMHTHVDGGQTRLSLPRVAPSVYFMRLTNGSGTHVQKIIIEKNS